MSNGKLLNAHRIVERLYMGAYPEYRLPREPRFTMLVLTAWEKQPLRSEAQDIARGAVVVRIPLDDADETFDEKLTPRLVEVGELIAHEIRRSGRVLVTCAQGINRSGLVVAHALLAMGFKNPVEIVQARRRVPGGALRNPHFVRHIENFARERRAA